MLVESTFAPLPCTCKKTQKNCPCDSLRRAPYKTNAQYTVQRKNQCLPSGSYNASRMSDSSKPSLTSLKLETLSFLGSGPFVVACATDMFPAAAAPEGALTSALNAISQT